MPGILEGACEAQEAKLVPNVAPSLLLWPGHLWPGHGGSQSRAVPPLLALGGGLGMGVGCVSGGVPGCGALPVGLTCDLEEEGS